MKRNVSENYIKILTAPVISDEVLSPLTRECLKEYRAQIARH